LLYELLTGALPFDKERLETSGLEEFKRIIQEEEPPKPSSRLSSVNAAHEMVAEKHCTNFRRLTEELSGELDWIVLKALAKDRAQRYESASDFARCSATSRRRAGRGLPAIDGLPAAEIRSAVQATTAHGGHHCSRFDRRHLRKFDASCVGHTGKGGCQTASG
jgi:serine/threonine protein kinase